MRERANKYKWLHDVRAHCAQKAPDLLSLFDIYAAEAVFKVGTTISSYYGKDPQRYGVVAESRRPGGLQ